jgi:hypothetical protein
MYTFLLIQILIGAGSVRIRRSCFGGEATSTLAASEGTHSRASPRLPATAAAATSERAVPVAAAAAAVCAVPAAERPATAATDSAATEPGTDAAPECAAADAVSPNAEHSTDVPKCGPACRGAVSAVSA